MGTFLTPLLRQCLRYLSIDLSKTPKNPPNYAVYVARPDMTGVVKCTDVVTFNALQTTNIVTLQQPRFPNVTVLQCVPIDINPVVFKDDGLQKGGVVLRGKLLGSTTMRSPNKACDLVGIVWKYTVTTPAAFVLPKQTYPEGLWMFVQLIDPNRPGNSSKSFGLDNWCPYTYCLPANPPFYADGTEGTFADGPFLTLANPPPAGISQYNQIGDSFQTYVMYQPPGAGSDYVPVDEAKWKWRATVDYQMGIWSFGGPHYISASEDKPYTDPFPVWSSAFQNS